MKALCQALTVVFLAGFLTVASSLVVKYPEAGNAPVGNPNSARAVYQPYGPSRIEASNLFDKWSRSQHFEDKALFSRYFYGMVNGTVIESGAMNGVKYSNSYAFYKALNWRTLNIEGNPRIYERLNRDRLDSINVQAALCSVSQKVHYIDAKRSAAVGGILEFMPSSFVRQYYQMPNFDSSRNPNSSFTYTGFEPHKANITEVDCVPFSYVLKEVGIVQADLWILDVEGGEYEVLKGTDFSLIKVGVIMIEAQHQSADACVKLLKNAGYRQCQPLATNLVCTHEDFVPSMIH